MTRFLIVVNGLLDLHLNFRGELAELSGPTMPATGALHHDNGEASDDDHAAVVMTLRADNRERIAGVRHGWGTPIVMQSLRRNNASLC